jgi:hypothetical protein
MDRFDIGLNISNDLVGGFLSRYAMLDEFKVHT